MTDALLDEDEARFQEAVRAFVDREIAPHAGRWDRAGRYPRELLRRLGEPGWVVAALPAGVGGGGGGRAAPRPARGRRAPPRVGRRRARRLRAHRARLRRRAPPRLRRAAPAGPARCPSRRAGRLRGPRPGRRPARAPGRRLRGLSLFRAERGQAGLSVGPPMEKLGMGAAETAEIVLDGCRLARSARLGPEGTGVLAALGG